MTLPSESLRSIATFKDLLRFLEDQLGWPLEQYPFEDLTYEYSPELDLGLKLEEAASIKAVHQLRPLYQGQPWGVFFVEFEKKKLPVVAMRRILSALVLKKRASGSRPEQTRWAAKDLLFISAFGQAGAERELAFAHFHEEEGDLPTLRVLGWDGDDTVLKLDHVEKLLRDKLRWPADEKQADSWREQWASAFQHRSGHVIRTADLLADELAALARRIRDKASRTMDVETERGPLTRLFKAFQSSLLHDLTEEGFADTYAQTITYGLLTAAISRTDKTGGEGTALVADNIHDMVPVTNPFLRDMLQTFLKAGGRRRGGMDFDELGVQDVVELLRDRKRTDLAAVIRDFGNRKPGEDPVIHFYEHFLSAYNKKLKIQRGVFYTPQPVVSYIVRSVHELLQTEFGLPDGLASTETWGQMIARSPELRLPPKTDEPGDQKTISPDEPFVQILDPATGTATFLVEVIDVIHKHLDAKWKSGGAPAMPRHSSFIPHPSSFSAFWNDYVPKALLPRLYAYELMMAPYAIAHMKIGLKLAETGYLFGSKERAHIYLTNALEPKMRQIPTIGFEALAKEAEAVNEIKWYKRFTVVIGNPPYSGNSSNRGEWIENFINDYRKVDGKPLGEVKVWLKDDYVKFTRFSEHLLATTHVGILGFITNNSFFDGLTFRGMRHHLLSHASCGYFINLHGNGNLKERAPDGALDENVFDILQGVGITLLIKSIAGANGPSAFSADLYGTREAKYQRLASARFLQGDYVATNPKTPNYFVVRQNEEGRDLYEKFVRVADLFEIGGLGFQSHRDNFVVAHSAEEITTRMKEFFNLKLSDKEVKERFSINDYRRFVVGQYRRQSKFDKACVHRLQYRPFDYRHIYYARDIVQEWQIRFHGHLLKPNLGLNVMRQTKAPEWRHVMVSSTPTPAVFVEIKDGSSQFPLWRYTELEDSLFATKGGRVPNLNQRLVDEWFTRLGIIPSWIRSTSKAAKTSTPEDIFNYAYAVFHSPGYRSRYVEFLKIDFPRLPLTGNLDLFLALARLGGELVALHLLESPKLGKPRTEFSGDRKQEVEKVTMTGNTVWIDKAQTTGFTGIPEAVWNFHIGGYQVCEKWLKDRKGRTLSKDDITHYGKIVIALGETIRLMKEIDEVIEQHGGWPGAFATGPAIPDAPEAAPAELDLQPPPGPAPRPPKKRTKAAADNPDQPQLPFNSAPRTATGRAKKKAVRKRRQLRTPTSPLPDPETSAVQLRGAMYAGHLYTRDQIAEILLVRFGRERASSAFTAWVNRAIRTAVRDNILLRESGGYRLTHGNATGHPDLHLYRMLLSCIPRQWTPTVEAQLPDLLARKLGAATTGPWWRSKAAQLLRRALREKRVFRSKIGLKRIR